MVECKFKYRSFNYKYLLFMASSYYMILYIRLSIFSLEDIVCVS